MNDMMNVGGFGTRRVLLLCMTILKQVEDGKYKK